MESFKIKVTPEQSRIVQEEMFKREYSWYIGRKGVVHTKSPYLYFENYNITHGLFHDIFVGDELPELTFEEFEAKYLKS